MENIDILKQNKWLLMILLLATIFRFYHLDFQSLWMDEIYTMNVTSPKLSWLECHKELIKKEGFPYLYFVVVKIFFSVFGYTGAVARSISVCGGIASVYAIYLIGKELIDKNVGLTAALLVAVNEYQIYVSQDARPYTLYFFATVFSFYRLIVFLKNNNLKNGIYYGLSLGLLLNINFFGFINVFSQTIILLIFIALSSKENRFDLFKKSFLSGVIALLLFAPNYLMLQKLLKYKAFWVNPPKSDSFSLLFSKYFGESEIIFCIIIPIFLYYFFQIFKNIEDDKLNYKTLINNKLLFSFVVLFVWFFVYFSFLMIKSYGKISYLLARYFISITPVLFIILAIGIHLIKGRIVKTIVLFSLVFFTLTNLFVVKKYYSKPQKSQFRELSNFVIKNSTKTEKCYSEYKYWYDYYFNNKQLKTSNITFEKLIKKIEKAPEKPNSFWYIGIYKKPYLPSKTTQDFVNKNYIVDNHFDGIQVWGKHFVLINNLSSPNNAN